LKKSVTLIIGLLLNDLSPVKVQSIGFVDTAPNIRREVVPEFPAFKTWFGCLKPHVPTPLTTNYSASF